MEFGDKPRVDEELSQAKARLWITVVALFYVGGLAVFSSKTPSRFIVGALAAYLFLSIFWFLWVRRRPGRLPYRRVLVIFADLGINTLFMYSLGAQGAVFYPLYLWIIVGNGVRFGGLYLILSMAVGAGYFLGLLVISPYWRANLVAGGGLWLGLIVLPLFYLSLIRRLYSAHDELEAQLARARQAERAKEEFLANMTHELRTPLNGVLGVSRLLRSTRLTDEQGHYVTLMERSSQFLMQVIEEILDFSRINRENIELEEASVDLRALLEEVLLLAEAIPEEKSVAIRLAYPEDAPRHFLGDPLRLRQIFFNLVGNAVKFTDEGAVTVRCRFRGDEEGPVHLLVEVEDTGVGIEEDRLASIFEQFQQADTRYSRRFRGAGLGLSISRRLAQAMGGDIQVASRPGEGSTFTVQLTLPLDPDPPVPEPEEGVQPRRDYGLRALVAEDDETSQVVAQFILQSLGIASEVAKDGVEVLKMWREGEYDLILMDMQMPKMDGLEATRRIREAEAQRRDLPEGAMPIIALTANVSDQDVELCIAAGMTAHLQKPMLMEDVVSLLDFLIEEGELARERTV